MPASGFLALLDDIATVLDDVAILTKVAAQKATAVADDVAVLSKVAAKKTAGVLGDDLALNAEQVTGVRAERELPVVWGVFKGSLVNKADPRPRRARHQRGRAVGGDAAADGRRAVSSASRASRRSRTSSCTGRARTRPAAPS